MVQRTTRKQRILVGSLLLVGVYFSAVRDHWAERGDSHLHRSFLSTYVQRTHPGIHPVDRDRLVHIILTEAPRLQIENATIDGKEIDQTLFLTAVIETESTFKADAVSVADARGYMQLMPATSRWMGQKFGLGVPVEKDLFRPEINLPRGVIFINHLMSQLGGDVRLVCLAYNAGLGNVQRGYFEERYWWKILTSYRRLASEAESNRWMTREVSLVRDI